MKIRRSTLASEPEFSHFWTAALAYQKSVQLPLWPPYPKERIKDEIRSGLHFSVFLSDDVLVGYFSLVLADAVIWVEREQGDAVYIHRMCVNPARKGNNIAGAVLTWAQGYAAGSGRKYIRMDTWGDNPKLIRHYAACGFQHIGNRQLGLAPELPPHYNNANLALFENEI